MSKPKKKEIETYLQRKYMNNFGGDCKPKNISYELISGTEFAYIKTIGGKKGITINKTKNGKN